MPSDLAQRYDDIWQRAQKDFRAGTVAIEPLPVNGYSRWGICLLARIHKWPPALTALAAQIRKREDGNVFVYDESNAHITIRVFENYRASVPRYDVLFAQYHEIMLELLQAEPAWQIALRGLSAHLGGIIVQGFPAFDLQAFRLRLHEAFARRNLLGSGPERDIARIRNTAHMSLALFESPLAHPRVMAELIEANRQTDFGTFQCGELQIAGFERKAGSVRVIDYITFPLKV